MYSKSLLSICIILSIAFASFANNTDPKSKPKSKSKRSSKKEASYKTPVYTKEVILDRLHNQNCPVDIHWNSDVKKAIKEYTTNGKRSSEVIIGRSAIYFPIFEKYLEEYGLPQDLKYLTVIESLLNPKVVSSRGAAGLWQFMPATARSYGIIIDNYVDERFDPYRATEAAMLHLSHLYNRFEDWTLVIAAYNCGEGRLQKAIKKARSKDFQKLRKYLPKETQKYVSRFISATYIMNNYIFHDIHPAYPDYNLQLTKKIKIYQRKTFKQLATDTGYSLAVIEKLNPGYKKNIIPPSSNGYQITLPGIN